MRYAAFGWTKWQTLPSGGQGCIKLCGLGYIGKSNEIIVLLVDHSLVDTPDMLYALGNPMHII